MDRRADFPTEMVIGAFCLAHGDSPHLKNHTRSIFWQSSFSNEEKTLQNLRLSSPFSTCVGNVFEMVLKVVVCGGGIGGLTTALCIDRLCGDHVALEVFEQAPQYKVTQKFS